MEHQQSAPQWSGKAFEEAAFKLRPEGSGGFAERKPVLTVGEEKTGISILSRENSTMVLMQE